MQSDEFFSYSFKSDTSLAKNLFTIRLLVISDNGEKKKYLIIEDDSIKFVNQNALV